MERLELLRWAGSWQGARGPQEPPAGTQRWPEPPWLKRLLVAPGEMWQFLERVQVGQEQRALPQGPGYQGVSWPWREGLGLPPQLAPVGQCPRDQSWQQKEQLVPVERLEPQAQQQSSRDTSQGAPVGRGVAVGPEGWHWAGPGAEGERGGRLGQGCQGTVGLLQEEGEHWGLGNKARPWQQAGRWGRLVEEQPGPPQDPGKGPKLQLLRGSEGQQPWRENRGSPGGPPSLRQEQESLGLGILETLG